MQRCAWHLPWGSVLSVGVTPLRQPSRGQRARARGTANSAPYRVRLMPQPPSPQTPSPSAPELLSLTSFADPLPALWRWQEQWDAPSNQRPVQQGFAFKFQAHQNLGAMHAPVEENVIDKYLHRPASKVNDAIRLGAKGRQGASHQWWAGQLWASNPLTAEYCLSTLKLHRPWRSHIELEALGDPIAFFLDNWPDKPMHIQIELQK
eukprot:3850362-Prymnesium_polylepis.1